MKDLLKFLYGSTSCGCGASEPDEDEIEEAIREVEEERKGIPVVIPVTPERIAAPDWPTPKKVEVESR